MLDTKNIRKVKYGNNIELKIESSKVTQKTCEEIEKNYFENNLSS